MCGRFSNPDDESHPLSVSRRQRQTAPMAVVLRLTVSPATQEQFNELDALVGKSMMEAGGPPEGLMSHVVYPEDNGFVIAEVWRTEPAGRTYVEDVLRPLVTGLDLTAGELEIRSVWSFAMP